jgi:hypothetical protein
MDALAGISTLCPWFLLDYTNFLKKKQFVARSTLLLSDGPPKDGIP